MKILIVEDSKAIRLYIERLVRRENKQVELASVALGDEGMQELQKEPRVDLLITDDQLTDKAGNTPLYGGQMVIMAAEEGYLKGSKVVIQSSNLGEYRKDKMRERFGQPLEADLIRSVHANTTFLAKPCGDELQDILHKALAAA